MCEGDECEAIVRVTNVRLCEGSKCEAVCEGDECEAVCEGDECEAVCEGDECAHYSFVVHCPSNAHTNCLL